MTARAWRRAVMLPAIGVRNPVLLTLVAAAAGAVATGGFVELARNRLVSGRPIALWAAAGGQSTAAILVLGLALLAAAFAAPGKALNRAQGLAAAMLLLFALAAAGESASRLAAGAPAAARVSLGTGFWVLLGAAALAIVDAGQRLGAGIGLRLLTVAAIAAAVAAMAAAGMFDALALAREYHTRRQAFGDALLRHVTLVAAAVGPALAIGVPLGIAAARRPRLRGPLFAILNLLQTIPSIALFGLLIVPLSALAAVLPVLARHGIGGIGMMPAIIALVLYALLPIVRNTTAGLLGVDPAIIEAARGMGLTQMQILWRVELPLAAPVLVAGVRIVTVQAIGLAVVAALIGAGGLGSFVFAGLGQYAVDLVLLGALPAIFLALAADFLLQSLAEVLHRRIAR